MLDNFSSSLFRIMFGRHRTQSIVVHVVFLRELIGRSDDELELVGGYTEGRKDSFDHVLVVIHSMLDELYRSFEVVEKGVHI